MDEPRNTQRTARIFVALVSTCFALGCSSRTVGSSSGPSAGDRSAASVAEGLSATQAITLSAPNPVSPTAPALEASNSVTLGSAANVSGTVVALGSGSLGFNAGSASVVTQDVWSRAFAELGSDAQVDGTLHASSSLSAPGVVLGGTDTTPQFDPTSTLTWNVAYPPGTASNVTVSAGATRALAPGLYGTVTTKSGSKLELSAGTYYLTGLSLAQSSTVTLDQSNGPVIVYVTGAIALSATFSSPAGPAANFFVGYLGTQPIVLGGSGAPFYGAIVAPATSITFDAATASHAGFFAATDIVLAAGAQVQYAAPSALVTASAPRVVCVEKTAPGTYVALFGYNNASGTLDHVTVGANNQLSPGSAGQGQLEDFLPINSPGAFAVVFNGSPLTWTLAGGTAIASAQSPACSTQACAPGCRQGQQCVGGQCVTQCGDGLCGGDETCNTCPTDCACKAGSVCVRNSCATPATCRVDWQCGSGTSFGVSVDCGGCPGGAACVGHVCL